MPDTLPPLNDAQHALINDHIPYARQLAGRYRTVGCDRDDLEQVALLGLVNAARRFDPDRGSAFYAFATPTILGEIKKYFRDSTWLVRVPRGEQDTALMVNGAVSDGARSVKEICDELGMSEHDVRSGQEALLNARTALSLDHPLGVDSLNLMVAESVGGDDRDLLLVEQLHDLWRVVDGMNGYYRSLLHMRYVEELTQAEIAERLGLSQVQVSRMISTLLMALRIAMTDGGRLPPKYEKCRGG